MITVEVIEKFFDEEAGVEREPSADNAVFDVDEKRLNKLLGDNVYGRPFVKILEENSSNSLDENQDEDLTKLNNDVLKERLDVAGVAYEKKATKAELIALVLENHA
ncbi:TPA: hypothetical protein U1V77_001569 [Streptococcus suis]|nr:hypothetical protein [Streptococcus suis]